MISKFYVDLADVIDKAELYPLPAGHQAHST
jgi:hypothetical protein